VRNAVTSPREVTWNQTLFVVTGKPDDEGKQSFTAYWRTDYIPGKESRPEGRIRAQCFHADLAWHVKNAKDSGKKIIVEDHT
jgi:hypothetical protein